MSCDSDRRSYRGGATSNDEIAELRRVHEGVVAEGWTLTGVSVVIAPENAAFLVAANNAMTRLLDELEFLRANVRDYFTGKDDVYTSASVALAQHVRALANTEREA